MISTSCLESFVKSFLTDILVKDTFGIQLLVITAKLNGVVNVYNQNKSDNTISNIGNNLLACVSPHFAEIETIITEEARNVIIFIVIMTAILVVLIVVLFAILDKNLQYITIILLTVLFVLFYILLCYLFIINAKNNIGTVIASNEVNIENCVNTAINNLTVFEQTNANALQLALCSYTP